MRITACKESKNVWRVLISTAAGNFLFSLIIWKVRVNITIAGRVTMCVSEKHLITTGFWNPELHLKTEISRI